MENPVPIDHLEEKEGTRCIFTGECVRNEIDYGYLRACLNIPLSSA